MLFTPISPRIIYSVEVENPPTRSLRYRGYCRVVPRHFINAALPLKLEAFILPSTYYFPPSFMDILIRFFCLFFACPSPAQHSCSFDTNACDCCKWFKHMQDVSVMYGCLRWKWQTEVGCCHPYFPLFNSSGGMHTHSKLTCTTHFFV